MPQHPPYSMVEDTTPFSGPKKRKYKPRPEETIKYIEKWEVAKLLGKIKDLRNRCIFTLMYYAGLRASEPGLLNIQDLNLRDKRLYIKRKKGSISGEHLLSSEEEKLLTKWMVQRRDKKYQNCGDVLFPSSLMEPRRLQGCTIYRLFKTYAEKVGLPQDKCHPHILKHSIATHLIDAGEDIYAVKEWLGHRSVQNTVVYAKITPKRLEAMAAKVQALFYNVEMPEEERERIRQEARDMRDNVSKQDVLRRQYMRSPKGKRMKEASERAYAKLEVTI